MKINSWLLNFTLFVQYCQIVRFIRLSLSNKILRKALLYLDTVNKPMQISTVHLAPYHTVQCRNKGFGKSVLTAEL